MDPAEGYGRRLEPKGWKRTEKEGGNGITEISVPPKCITNATHPDICLSICLCNYQSMAVIYLISCMSV